MLAHFMFGAAHRKSLDAIFDQERRDPLTFFGSLVGDRPDHKYACIFRTRDEHLVAVEDVIIPVQNGGTAHPRRIGAGRRFRQSETAGIVFTGADFSNIGFLLLFRTNGLNDLAAHIIHGHGDGRGSARPGDFRNRDTESDHARFGATIFGFDIDTHQAELGQFFQIL